MKPQIKITTQEEYTDMLRTNEALKQKLAEKQKQNADLQAKQSTPDKGPDILKQLRESIQAADAKVQATNARIEASKTNDTPENFQDRFLNQQLKELEEKQASELKAFNNTWGNKKVAPKLKDLFTMVHLPNQEYFLGFSISDGVILKSTRKGFQDILLKVKSTEVIRLTDSKTSAANINGFPGQVVAFAEGDWTNRNLTVQEFQQLVQSKPKFNIIQSAYKTEIANAAESHDFNKRIDVTKATVIF